LWLRFLEIYKKHNVKFVWVKGHANNLLNERCDELAVAASMQTNLREDFGYQPDEKGNYNL
jgi:ribonuclease HI